jgi:divalent metal cation (Fe/Co/Zn/Cd) transporter
MPNDSMRTVLVALGSGLAVAVAKAVVAVFTGSSAMAAEASHSLADTANDLFLFVAQRRSTRRGAWLLPPAPSPRQDADDFTQPLRSADEDRIRAFLLGYPGVTAIREVLVTFTGPGQAWVTARLDIDDELTGAQVKSLVRGIESGMKRESQSVYRVDVVPFGGASA